MATPTYDLLDSVTLSSSASSVTFSSIDQSYRDLVLIEEFKGDTGNASGLHRFNSDSGTNYSYVFMLGATSGASSGSGTVSEFYGANANTTDAGFGYHHIMDYSATDKHKTILTRRTSNTSSSDVMALAQRWASTSAITSITIFTNSAVNYTAGSTFYLYGVAA